jgi:hypothetical protein
VSDAIHIEIFITGENNQKKFNIKNSTNHTSRNETLTAGLPECLAKTIAEILPNNCPRLKTTTMPQQYHLF